MSEQRWLNSREASAHVGYSIHTLANWRRPGAEGGPPFERRSGRQPRYRLDQLDAWMEGRNV